MSTVVSIVSKQYAHVNVDTISIPQDTINLSGNQIITLSIVFWAVTVHTVTESFSFVGSVTKWFVTTTLEINLGHIK